MIDINQIDTFIFINDEDLGMEVQDKLVTVSNDKYTTDSFGKNRNKQSRFENKKIMKVEIAIRIKK